MPYQISKYVIAAICGNFYQESGLNPGIFENRIDTGYGYGGYGLGQWTNNAEVSRKTALFNWLSAHGYARNSGDGQLEFLIEENSWLPYIISTRTGIRYDSSFANLEEFLESDSTDIEFLTEEFFHFWEGIDDDTFPTRYANAQKFYDNFQNPPSTRNPWAARNNYLTMDEITNNGYLIMDFFLDVPPVKIVRNGLKPWMIYYLT